MKKLGIIVRHVDRKESEREVTPTYPLLAFSYSRSGFIRLAGLKTLKK